MRESRYEVETDRFRLQAENAALKQLVQDFGPCYFSDMNRKLGLPKGTDLDTQMDKITDLYLQLDEEKHIVANLQTAKRYVEKQLSETNEFLLIYANHKFFCSSEYKGKQCDCGYAEALLELSKD